MPVSTRGGSDDGSGLDAHIDSERAISVGSLTEDRCDAVDVMLVKSANKASS